MGRIDVILSFRSWWRRPFKSVVASVAKQSLTRKHFASRVATDYRVGQATKARRQDGFTKQSCRARVPRRSRADERRPLRRGGSIASWWKNTLMERSRNACPRTRRFWVGRGRQSPVRFAHQHGYLKATSALTVVTVCLYFFGPQIPLLNGPGFSDINRWQRTRERKKGRD